jgi:hypothetical protein
MDGWKDGQIDVQVDKWVCWTGGQTDRLTDGWTNRQADRWTESQRDG